MLKNEKGAVLAEYALSLPLFLGLVFAVIDFSQIYMHWIMAEKATHLGVRTVAVRPPVCEGVPEVNARAANAGNLSFGASCADGGCQNPGATSCAASEADGAGLDDLIAVMTPLLPGAAGPEDILITYDYAGLGFLGGPYVPMVTVELAPDIDLPFITPFGPILAAFYGGGDQEVARLAIPPMRATMPGEDLGEGGAG